MQRLSFSIPRYFCRHHHHQQVVLGLDGQAFRCLPSMVIVPITSSIAIPILDIIINTIGLSMKTGQGCNGLLVFVEPGCGGWFLRVRDLGMHLLRYPNEELICIRGGDAFSLPELHSGGDAFSLPE